MGLKTDMRIKTDMQDENWHDTDMGLKTGMQNKHWHGIKKWNAE